MKEPKIRLALTLWQPWATAVVKHGKRIENRVWKPSPKILAERPVIAIHAGKKFEAAGLEWCVARGIPREFLDKNIVPMGAIVGTARVVDITTNSPSQWWIPGQYGWVLEEITSLDVPIPCVGAMGLWTLPGDIQDALELALRPLARLPRTQNTH